MISGTLFGIGAVLAIFITSRILFPDAKIFVLIRGFFSGWVEDKAKTPEGAKAIYTEKIKELQNSYNKANDTLQKIVGQKTTVEKELKHFKEELMEVEKNCEALAKKQKWEAVEEIADHREDLMAEIEMRENLLKELIPQVEEAQFINNKLEINLSNMKKEKDRIIRELIAKKQMKEIYDEMDELKNVSATSRMVQNVKEGLKEVSEQAEGAKVLYNNKKSTKYERAKQEAKAAISNSYVENLKNKYTKNSINVENQNNIIKNKLS